MRECNRIPENLYISVKEREFKPRTRLWCIQRCENLVIKIEDGFVVKTLLESLYVEHRKKYLALHKSASSDDILENFLYVWGGAKK